MINEIDRHFSHMCDFLFVSFSIPNMLKVKGHRLKSATDLVPIKVNILWTASKHLLNCELFYSGNCTVLQYIYGQVMFSCWRTLARVHCSMFDPTNTTEHLSKASYRTESFNTLSLKSPRLESVPI